MASDPTRHAPRLAAKMAIPCLLTLAALIGSVTIMSARHVPFNADQAMVGLMAQDIASGANHPVFYEGSEYGGTFESHFLVPLFMLIGSSVTSFRIGIGFLFLCVILAVWSFTRRAFGESEALFAGLYLALGPSYLLYKGLTSDGAYVSVLLVGALILLLLVRIETRSAAGEGTLREFVGVGILCGLGWWITMLCVVYFVPLAVFLILGRSRAALGFRAGLAFLGAFLLGGLPWWLRNFETGWKSLHLPGLKPPTAAHLTSQARSLVWDGLPILLGPEGVGARARAHFALDLLGFALLALLIFQGVRLARRTEDPRSRVVLCGLLALLASSPVLSLAIRGESDFHEPRYLLPMYLAIAPLAGLFVARARRLQGGLVVVVFAVLHLSGFRMMQKYTSFEVGSRASVERIVSSLSDEGIRAVYASYWTSYKLTFLSSGRVIASPFGTWNAVRRPRDRMFVDGSSPVGFLLEGKDAEGFESFLRVAGRSFKKQSVDDFQLFSSLDPELLAQARQCLCVPASFGPDAIEWREVSGPREMTLGSSATFLVRFTNRTLRPWPDGLNIGYHWRNGEGRDVEPGGARTAVNVRPAEGEEVGILASVQANAAPGDYRLVFDLVQEDVTWLEWKGLAPASTSVRIRSTAP